MAVKRVLITGGNTLLGLNLANALLSEGAEVTLLVRPKGEEALGVLAERVRWYTADVWDGASLRGRARGQDVVIHTVGSMTQDPSKGLTFHRLNEVSARNVANMCISDGVERLILMSASSMWWVNPQYIHSKRESERHIKRSGAPLTIVRAPLAYTRGEARPLFYYLLSALGAIPLLNLIGLRNVAPMPMDILARGVARLALSASPKPMVKAHDLRRLARRANPMPSPQ